MGSELKQCVQSHDRYYRRCDRTALIADITTAIASNRLPIHEINAHYLKNGNANIILTIEVSGIDQLKSIILRLQKIPGVISAERTGKQ